MLQWRIQDLPDGGRQHGGGVRQLIITARKQSLGQDNIFRSVCHEFCPRGGGGQYLGRYPPGPGTPSRAGTPPGTRYPPGRYTPRRTRYPRAGTPPSSACWEIRATSGRYASYWNAYLFGKVFADYCIKMKKKRTERGSCRP